MATTTDLLATLTLLGVDELSPVIARETAALKEMALVSAQTSTKMAAASTVQASSYDRAMASSVAASAKAQSALIAVAAAEDKAALSATRMAAAQEKAATKAGEALGGMATKFGLLGLVVAGFSVKTAVDFNATMQKMQGNTAITNQELDYIRTNIIRLGSDTSIPLNEIARAYEHAANIGFHYKDATDLVTASMKAAVATGGNEGDVLNALATVMGNFHHPASMATEDISILIKAAADGNVRLPELTLNFNKIGEMASAMHIPLADAAAVFSTLTKALGDPAMAQTQTIGMLNHLLNITGPAAKIMKELATTTGIDLHDAFIKTATGGMKFYDLMTLVKEATKGNAEEIFKLFGGIRGGGGALALLGSQWEAYNKTQVDLHDKTLKSGALLQSLFDKMSGTFGDHLGEFKNKVTLLGMAIGTVLIPALDQLVTAVSAPLSGMTDWITKNQQATNAILVAVGTGGAYLVLIATLGKIADAWYKIRDAEIAARLANPIGLSIAVLAGAAVAGKMVGDSMRLAAEDHAKLLLQFEQGKITLKQYTDALNVHNGSIRGSVQAYLDAAAADAIHAKAVYQSLNAYVEGKITLKQYLDLQGQMTDEQRHQTQSTAELAKGYDALKDKEEARNKAINEHHASLTTYNSDLKNNAAAVLGLVPAYEAMTKAAQRFTDQQSRATNAQNVLATAIENGVSGAALAKIVTWAATMQAAADKGSAAQTKAASLITAALGKTSTALHDYAADADTILAQHTIHQATSFTAWADSAIAQAKRLRDGVVSQVQMMAKEVQIPLPMPSLLKTPFTPDYGPASKAFDQAAPIPHGTAAQALALSPEANASFQKFDESIKGMPAAFRADLQPVFDGFHVQLANLYNDYIDKVNKENASYADRVQKIYDQAGEKAKKYNEDAQAELKKFYDQYLVNLKKIEDTYNNTLAKNLAAFTTEFSRALATFQAGMLTENVKAQAALSAHNQKLQTDLTDYNTRLAAIHGKNQDQQRANLFEWYKRRVTADDDSYKKQLAGYTAHATQMTTVFNTATGRFETTLTEGDKKAATTRDQAVTANDASLKTHAKDVKTHLDNHIKGLNGWIATHLTGLKTTHDAFLAGLRQAFERGATSLAGGIDKANTPAGMLDAGKKKAQDDYNNATATGTFEIVRFGHETAATAAWIQRAGEHLQVYTDAETQAGYKVKTHTTAVVAATKEVDLFAEALKASTDQMADDVGKLAAQIYAGTFGQDQKLDLGGQRRAQSIGSDATTVNPTTAALDDYTAAYVESKKRIDANNAALLYAAQTTGDFTEILKQTDDAAKKLTEGGIAEATLYFKGLGGDISHATATIHAWAVQNETDLQATARANAIQTTEEINAAIKAGDLGRAFTLLSGQTTTDLKGALDTITGAMRLGIPVTDAMVASWQTAKAAQDADTQATINAARLVGDASTELAARTKQAGDAYKVALDGLTLKILDHQTVTQADINVVVAARQQTETFTTAIAEATYATASLAEKQKTLIAMFQPTISQDSTISGSASSIQSADLAVLAAASAVEVNLLQQQVTATTDLAGIMTAQQKVSAAGFTGQLAAITDGTKIMQDVYGIQSATNPAMLKVAQDQLAIDRVTAMMHQADAQWQIRIAQDELRIATDKAQTDQANIRATGTVLMDQLKVAQDQRQLAIDQAQLTGDTLPILDSINYALGGADIFGAQIAKDLANIGTDRANIYHDQSVLQGDQSAANVTAQQGAQTLAGDTLTLTSDQGAAAAASQAYQLQLAQMNNTLAADQIREKQLAAINSSIQQLNANDAAQIAALESLVRMSGEQPHVYVGGSNSGQMLNQLGGQVKAVQSH